MSLKNLTNNQKKGLAVVAGVGVAAGVIYYLQKAMAPKTDELLTDGGLFGGGGITPGGLVIPEFKEEKGIPQDNLFPNGGGANGGNKYTPLNGGSNPPNPKSEAFPSLPNQFPGLSELPLWSGAGGGTLPFGFDKLNVGESELATPKPAQYIYSGTGRDINPIINLARYSGAELYKPFQAIGQKVWTEKRVPNIFELATGAGEFLATKVAPYLPSQVSVPLGAIGMGTVTIRNPFQPQVEKIAPVYQRQISSFGSASSLQQISELPRWGTGEAQVSELPPWNPPVVNKAVTKYGITTPKVIPIKTSRPWYSGG